MPSPSVDGDKGEMTDSAGAFPFVAMITERYSILFVQTVMTKKLSCHITLKRITTIVLVNINPTEKDHVRVSRFLLYSNFLQNT